MTKIITAFSYIFHPLFISVYAVLIYFIFGKHYFRYEEIYFVLLQIIVLTIFIPITFYYLLLSLGKVDSIMMADKKQRILPLIVHCILLYYIIRKCVVIEVFYELNFFFLGCLISSFLALIGVILGLKASLHMIGISILTIFTIGLSIHYQTNIIHTICFLVLCNGIVASSRLTMKAHDYKELISGFFIGIIPQLILMKIWL